MRDLKMQKKTDWTLQDLRIKLNFKILKMIFKNLKNLFHNYYKYKGEDMWSCTNHNLVITREIVDVMNEYGLQPLKIIDSLVYCGFSGTEAKIFLAYGNSMSPTINPTDILILVPRKPKVDDIVGVDNKVHRVTKIKEIDGLHYITTKGDNNEENEDDIISIDFCYGVIKKIIKREEHPELYDTLHSIITKI